MSKTCSINKIQCRYHSRWISRFGSDKLGGSGDLETESLWYSDSDIDSVCDSDEVISEDTGGPSPTSPAPLIGVAFAECQDVHVDVNEVVARVQVRKEVEKNIEVEDASVCPDVAVRRRRSHRVRVGSIGVALRTRSCCERATRSNVRAGRARLFHGL